MALLNAPANLVSCATLVVPPRLFKVFSVKTVLTGLYLSVVGGMRGPEKE